MNRSVSPPVHLHVGRKTPVHVHLKPPKQRLSKMELQELSCSEMSAGRPSLRASGTHSASSRSNYWASPSPQPPWVLSPGKSSKITWEGPTHRLEINPDPSGSVLRVSDLGGDEITTAIISEDQAEFEDKVDSLQAEVDNLKAEISLQKSLRDLDMRESALKESQDSIRRKKVELTSSFHSDCELESSKLKSSLSSSRKFNKSLSLPSSRRNSPHRSRSRSPLDVEDTVYRDRLLAQLAEVEIEGSVVMKNGKKLKAALQKFQKEKKFVSLNATAVLEKKDSFLESLKQFEKSNRLLSKMIHTQRLHLIGVSHLVEHRDYLEQKFQESEIVNHELMERLEEQEKLVRHSHGLHDEIGMKEGELQGLQIRLQSMEEQLRCRDLECVQLQNDLCDSKVTLQREKDQLKKSLKEQKDYNLQQQQNLEIVNAHLEEVNADLFKIKGKLAKSDKEIIAVEAENTSHKSHIQELEAVLAQTRLTSNVSMDAVNAQLSERTHELSFSQREVDRLNSIISTLETRLHTSENAMLGKMSGIESENSQLKGRLTHCEGLIVDYKTQLERCRVECEELNRELRSKEHDIEHLKHEGFLEAEKCRIKLQHRVAELESVPELLKCTEQRLSDVQEQLMTHEQRSGEQNRLIAELTVKLEQSTGAMESLRAKLCKAISDKRAVEAQLISTEKRAQESEQQSRELMGISGRKEEMVQRLQSRVEELVQEMAGLSAQIESGKVETRRHNEQLKERASSKERANIARIAELESQVSRANNLATQFRKSKEDLDKRYQSRVHELQERLEQANSTKRSLENYITFLKSSYTSVFSDPTHASTTLTH